MDDEQLTMRLSGDERNKSWYRADGSLHSIEFSYTGNKYWYDLKGNCHREDGPAIELADGRRNWYWHGKLINCTTQEEFEQLMRLKAFW